VEGMSEQEGKTEKTSTSSTFYFDSRHLIYVNEKGNMNGKEMKMEWYYTDDKPLYYTLKTERAEERSCFL
jgi:hypothetical protein